MREDNSRDRMYQFARKYSLVSTDETASFLALKEETHQIEKKTVKINVFTKDIGKLGEKFIRTDLTTLENLIKQPGQTIADSIGLMERFAPELTSNLEAAERAVISIRYSGYVAKQEREIEKFKKLENLKIPLDFDYSSIIGLKTEAKEKFCLFRPSSLGQAGRIEGVTPGDVSVLSIFLAKRKSIA